MADIKLPVFQTTSIADIPAIVTRLHQTFRSRKTLPVEYRLKQLRKLYWAIEGHQDELVEALHRDLHKSYFEAIVSEVGWVKNNIIFISQNIQRWVKDESPPDIAWAHKLMSPRIRKDPLGVVLVIGAFNFPVMLSLDPVIGAIAAGNTVLLKPSEMSSHSAAVMQKIIGKSLDYDSYAVVQGGIPETTALLEQKWDKIFFTGSAPTGKVIAQAAAKTLTPVTLELGGKNPAIVTKAADIRLAARRLLWAKTTNAGQVCISQNYILVERAVVSLFVEELKSALKDFFPEGAQMSKDFGRLVNSASFNRVKKMLDSTTGKVVAGGTMEAKDLYIEPTVILVTDPKDSLLVSESFGPLIPILAVDSLDEAIAIANETHETPLAVYAFGSKLETNRVLESTRSGGVTINDGFFHGVISTMPFGGVGDSGSGSYRGKASFDCFSHQRSVATTPGWMESMLAMRYPPFYGTKKLKQFNRMSQLSPDFDRDGNTLGWLEWLLGSKGAFLSVLLVMFLVAVALLR